MSHTRADNVDDKLRAAILAAVQAYMASEDTAAELRSGPRLSPWKMGARREVLGRRSLAERGDPFRNRLNRFTLR